MMATDTTKEVLRGIAVLEVVKGLLAMAAGLGLLGLRHHDLHQLAASLIGHVGLRPGGHYPAWALSELDRALSADHLTLLLTLTGYATVRFAEALGLWRARPWGERLGAVSGALYVPFELQHLLHRPSVLGAGVLVVNLALVAFLVWRLKVRRAAAAGGPDAKAAPDRQGM